MKHASETNSLHSEVAKLKEELYSLSLEKETVQLEKDKLAKKLQASQENARSQDDRIKGLLSSNSEFGQSALERYVPFIHLKRH